MKYHNIPRTSLNISIFGLGSMTFGEQVKEHEAYSQLDYATNIGINFIDTAEIYPVPSRPETQGISEKIIGNWLKKKRVKRENIILASKVSGPVRKNSITIRDNQILDCINISKALEYSLKRLNTDYLDIYQIHWPQRTTNCLGKLNYQYTYEKVPVSLMDTLEALDKEIKYGKIRYIGVSNETPWGIMSYLKFSELYNLPRIITVQNPYNLLNRSFEIGLAEISQLENIELIAYSALAFGTLTGKYLNNRKPKGARNTLFSHFTRYNSKYAQDAIDEYVKIAKKYSLNPAQMALAFVQQQSFVASILLGVTSLHQLKTNLESLNIILDEEVICSLENIHKKFTIPSP